MNENAETRLLADRILDRPSGDADDDLAMLSRQLLRTDEQVLARDNEISVFKTMLRLYRTSERTVSHGKTCRFRKYPDWVEDMDDRCDVCKVVDGLL